MDHLPLELLEEVLSHLPPSDRLNSAATCHRWAEAVAKASLLDDVRVTIHGCEWTAAQEVFVGSRRQYRNLRLSKVYLGSYNSGFWMKLGGFLRELELDRCLWSPGILYSILRSCPDLESLKISESRDMRKRISIGDFEFPKELSFEEIRSSLSMVRHLDLNFFLTEELLTHLLGLMPKVTSVSLTMFDPESDFLDLLPNILGANRRITKLDLRDVWLSPEEFVPLMNICSMSLRELLCQCREFDLETFETIAGCTELRHLSLSGYYLEDTTFLGKLLLNAPGIEILELNGFRSTISKDSIPIHGLKKIRKLSLPNCLEMLRKFVGIPGQLSMLQCLDLRRTEVDFEVLQGITRLPNLHTFHATDLDSESFGLIVENLKNLEALDIMGCDGLSDTDGMKISNLRKLKRLSLARCFAFTDLFLQNGLGSPTMETLELQGCRLTDSGLVGIANHHNRLRSLALYSCPNVTESGLLTLLCREPLLMKLELGFLYVTEEFLKELAKLCPRLRFLGTTNCTRISSCAMKSFRTHRPGVEIGYDSAALGMLSAATLD